jgi:processive 1,2-diacylglycerol beta-glucosyltransferase
MWLSRAFQRYFVAMNETKASLESLGLPSDRVTVSGIPIDPVFSVPIDRLNECRRLALEPTRPIVLLSAGAAGSGPAEFMVQQLMMLDDRIQVVIVCGHNLDLRNRIDAIVQANPRFRVLGYTDAMSTLMQLADLLIGKPGGMTSAEALAAGLPMCIVNPIPGQEERNSDHLLEEGVAIKCNDLGALAYKVGQLLDRPDRLANMRANASRLARPFAARTVVNTLLDESHNIPPLALTRHQRLKMSIARRS